MTPRPILAHLEQHGVPFTHRGHPFAISAQHVAEKAHISGFRLAKTVVLQVDGRLSLAAIPAPCRVDLQRLAALLGAREVRLMREAEFVSRFPGCEAGAEPPFGSLYGAPVLMDEALREQARIAVNDGTHDALLELPTPEFERMERPFVASFAVLPERPTAPLDAELPSAHA
jgi:Ala-tRNA(Pro) deacylase